jgi:C-terminal processing protease CtpA/Prc
VYRFRKVTFIIIGILFLSVSLVGYLSSQKEAASTEAAKQMVTNESALERATGNIKTFAKLYGYIKYFHPSDESDILNWEVFALYGVQQVVGAKDNNELKSILEELFYPIAPTLQIYHSDEKPKKVEDKKGPNLIAWQHYGHGSKRYPGTDYESKRVTSESDTEIKIFEKTLEPETTIIKKINSDLNVQIPLVLYKTEIGTFRTKKSLKEFERLRFNLKYAEREERSRYLASAVITWNVFQHFYPDLHLLDVNWEDELDQSISRILVAQNEVEFERGLQSLLNKAGDGYTAEFSPTVQKNYLPFQVDWVENELTVTVSESPDLQVGDHIVTIDGEPVKDYFTKLEDQFSGSKQWKKHQALQDFVSSESGEDQLTFKIKRDGSEIDNIKATYYSYSIDPFSRTQRSPIQEIEQRIYYVNQTALFDYHFYGQFEKLSKAKGIIFDFRGFPDQYHLGKLIIGHLINQPVKLPIIQVPKIIYPDQQEIEFENVQWTIEPQEQKFTGKVVFLTYGGPMGESELLLEVIKHNKLAELVGQETSGENGGKNAIRIFMPRQWIYWTGSRFLKEDGSQHHLIGVQPSVRVERTLEGVKQGKDEYIEKAIEVINSKR